MTEIVIDRNKEEEFKHILNNYEKSQGKKLNPAKQTHVIDFIPEIKTTLRANIIKLANMRKFVEKIHNISEQTGSIEMNLSRKL